MERIGSVCQSDSKFALTSCVHLGFELFGGRCDLNAPATRHTVDKAVHYARSKFNNEAIPPSPPGRWGVAAKVRARKRTDKV